MLTEPTKTPKGSLTLRIYGMHKTISQERPKSLSIHRGRIAQTKKHQPTHAEEVLYRIRGKISPPKWTKHHA